MALKKKKIVNRVMPSPDARRFLEKPQDLILRPKEAKKKIFAFNLPGVPKGSADARKKRSLMLAI